MSVSVISSGMQDLDRGNYMDAYPPPKIETSLQSLKDLGADFVGKTVKVHA